MKYYYSYHNFTITAIFIDFKFFNFKFYDSSLLPCLICFIIYLLPQVLAEQLPLQS